LSKFHDDQIVNEYWNIVLLGQVLVYVGKREIFGTTGKENEFERKREHRNL